MLENIASKNGEITSQEKAHIQVDNIEFSYGYGVYETIKVRNKIIYFPEEHIKRLFESCEVIKLTHQFSQKEVLRFLNEFTRKIQSEAYNIKINLIGTNEPNIANIYIFASSPLFLTSQMKSKGVKTILFNGERLYPKAKTMNMLTSYLAYKQAKQENAYDALLVDKQGYIHEGTRTNLFYTDGEKLYTPPKETTLEGVTQNTVIEALKKEGIKVIQRPLKKEELNSFKGYFLTSTSINILPINQIDENKFEISEIVKKAIKIYEEYLRDYIKGQK